MSKWTSLTERIPVIKDGGLTPSFKASRQEIAFTKVINRIIPLSLSELQKDAYEKAPLWLAKRKELLEHQEANRRKKKVTLLEK